jgi:hypothetical protein
MKKKLLFFLLFFCYAINCFSQTQYRDDAGLRGDQGATSGFFETSNPINFPIGSSGWWHLLDIRHSNPSNNFAMQFAGDFFSQELFFRKTSNNASQPWAKILMEQNGQTNIYGQSWFNYGNYNIAGYSWTNAALTTNSIEIVNNQGTVSTSSPTLAFHRYGSGGPQFRLASDGSNILYLESSGANSARNPNPYGGGPNNYFSKLYIDGALSVKGQIRSSEVKVDTGPWPDYVFDEKYSLIKLENLALYIKQHHHLPEIPGAREIENEGLNLGKMNILLIKKIEELTLYILQQEERIKRLENKYK